MNGKQIAILVFLFLIVAFLALGIKINMYSMNKEDVKNSVIQDLKHKFPDADKIEIMNMELKKNEKNKEYYLIKASVSFNLTTPCPSRVNYYYFYPEQNFVPNPPEYVVKDCYVPEGTPVLFEEEAIILSHTLNGTEIIQDYLKTHSPIPKVKKPNGNKYWEVDWDNYKVKISENGTLIGVE